MTVTTPINAKVSNKMMAKAGGYILSGMIAGMASDYVINSLDQLFDFPEEKEDKIEEEAVSE